MAYCKTLGKAFGNPLYHWSQVELKEFFDCELEINEKNALKIWDECNAYILKNKVTPQKLIEQSNVKYLFTTNEIFDDLEVFKKIKEKDYRFEVRPAFRADKIMNIEAEKYNEFVSRLGDIKSFDQLLSSIEERLNAFIKVGCVASDTALQQVYDIPSKEHAALIFEKRRKGATVSNEESKIFKGYLTYYLLKLYSKYHISLGILKKCASQAAKLKRETISLDKLVIGLKCGGSDGFSGITANPTIGKVSDKVISFGGSAILTEVPDYLKCNRPSYLFCGL